MPSLSLALDRTPDPPISAARSWAAQYRGEAGAMIDLTQAVPGYPPHPLLLDHLAVEAARAENAGYGPIDGDPALRRALAEDLTRSYHVELTERDIAITAGCNLAFSMVMTVVSGQRVEVLLPTPWYFNHAMERCEHF